MPQDVSNNVVCDTRGLSGFHFFNIDFILSAFANFIKINLWIRLIVDSFSYYDIYWFETLGICRSERKALHFKENKKRIEKKLSSSAYIELPGQ